MCPSNVCFSCHHASFLKNTMALALSPHARTLFKLCSNSLCVPLTCYFCPYRPLFTSNRIHRELVLLGPTLPYSWVVKPVGAAMYDGITVVVEGYDMWRKQPVNLKRVASSLHALRRRGGRANTFRASAMKWNLSTFLIEELVICESGMSMPVDYRVFVLGGRVLWVWINWYSAESHELSNAFLDTAYTMLPPAVDVFASPV